MSKREDNDANQLSKPLYTSKSGGAILMCAIVQCCWSEGLPNARQLNFGVGSIKKKMLVGRLMVVARGLYLARHLFTLSSPRAESARAVTGRRCPHSGRGEDFLSRQPDFFTETAVTPERKVEKSFPRWEINRHVEG